VRYDITHTTHYRYSEPVLLSHHVARLSPRPLARQTCLGHTLEIDPAPVVSRGHRDYHGNDTTFFMMEGAHRELRITARSRIEVVAPPPPGPAAAEPWERARDHEQLPLDVIEYVFESPNVRSTEEVAHYARASFPAGRPLLEAVTELMSRIHADFRFDTHATTIATPLADVMRLRRGVCQDFSQLGVGCLRAVGLAARYVSGYLETLPPPGKPRLVGADASHAWFAVYCPGEGWIDFDPTNNVRPGDQHITLGWGRDYGDVSPLRGVMLGGGEHQLSVAVDVLRLDD
jgi:transglutaminase-like putative cysteine protease